jgi:hypothetical protein
MDWRTIGSAAVTAAGGPDPRAALVDRLRSAYAATDALLTDSGTTALRLALQIAAGAGGTVAMPAWGCFDLVSAAVGAGVRLSFYDVDPQTLAADDASLAAAAVGAQAIVMVHPFGLPAPIQRFRDLAAEHGARLIEDAAMAGGGQYGDKALGSFGDLSVLSFGRGKGIGGGGGGALLARGSFANSLREVRAGVAASSSRAAEWRAVLGVVAHRVLAHPYAYGIPRRIPMLHLGETRYHQPGDVRGISAAAARLALAGVIGAAAAAEPRRAAAAAMIAKLVRADGLIAVGPAVRDDWGALRLPVLDRQRRESPRHVGVWPSYPRALPSLPAAQAIRLDARPTPGAELLATALRTVPTHAAVTERDREAIVQWYSRGAVHGVEHQLAFGATSNG